ncbi:MAM domain-containing glycosylphosphatidylinositol anchor protein 1 [Nymphon striatum]|nr:MAM domain-containing glycosylphosphatidylinositol anchor protein 1 [Nymphon striatum]
MTFFLGHFLYASHSLPPRETVLINSGTEISTSWILFNYNEKKWTKATVPIKVLNSYSIIFEAVRGNGDYGSIAIDDISIGSDQCSITPHSAAPDLSGKRYCILE